MKTRLSGLLAAALLVPVAAQAAEVDPIEAFALSKDRKLPLSQLIPGTEDYYYFHALQRQTEGRFDEVRELLEPWAKRYGETQRLREIVHRHALLTYDKNPQRTLQHLRRELDLEFDHRRDDLSAKRNLPSALDPNRVSRDALARQAYGRYRTSGFEEAALDWLLGQPLDPTRRRHLLSRLRRPDHPKLVEHVAEDLEHRGSRGFGSHKVHGMLLLSQLEELGRRMPALRNRSQFINAVLVKLRPADDIPWRDDRAAMDAYLKRLWSFVGELPPVHNSLKAHVLYHRLAFDWAGGSLNRTAFDAYVALPRNVGYADRDFLRKDDNRRYRANLYANFSAQTGLPPVGNDEPLVRALLLDLFRGDADVRTWEPYVDDTYLEHVFAEAKILSGEGDQERWYSLLPPAKYQQLKERVDLEFAPTTRSHYGAGEKVTLALDVKNVPNLIVKVYQLNVGNYYREHQREVDTDINLDGLVANWERRLKFPEPALRRVRRTFEFPEIDGPGVYVVDFIGNGRSSRALIRKGHLRVLPRTSTAGHELTVIDETGSVQPRASVWLGGREYAADTDGTVTVPFSNTPGNRQLVVSSGPRVSLVQLQHQAESYALRAGFHVERESLLEGKEAKVLVRAGLELCGTPVTLSLLQDVRLTVTSVDLDGIESTQEVGGFKLYEDRESVHTLRVPQRLASLRFQLNARVERPSKGDHASLQAERSFAVNGIDRTDKTEAMQLLLSNGDYILELRGKTGEPRAGRPVQLRLKHREFTREVSPLLQTDAKGRIHLGKLDGFVRVRATPSGGQQFQARLRPDRRTRRSEVHALEGEPIYVPTTRARSAARDEISLLELRGGQFASDRRDAIKELEADGTLRIEGLPRGDYDLLLRRSGTRIRLRVGKGARRGDWVVGDARLLERRNPAPLQLSKLRVAGGKLFLKVRNQTPQTRIHLFASRYVPGYAAYEGLSSVRDRGAKRADLRPARSVFVSGRNIGDEYRYILERQFAKTFPGNMLERPSVLLNPWAVRSTETSTQRPQSGDDFRGAGRGAAGRYGGSRRSGSAASAASGFVNLDFLAEAAAVAVNLTPSKDGTLEVPLADLGAHAMIHAVAVDPQNTVARSTSVSASAPKLRDRRLTRPLDPGKPFTERKQVSIVAKGAKFAVDDVRSATFEVYDSLARVHRLFTTLSGDAHLNTFRFVLDWDQKTFVEKCTLYSEHACHELSFFISRKDRKFFEDAVKPYLANKRDKTFMDHYLLGADLRPYLHPWAYGRLNVVERILLAQRIKGEQEATARHVRDRYDVLPPNPEQLDAFFRTALKSSELDAGDELGLVGLRDKLAKNMAKEKIGRLSFDEEAEADDDGVMSDSAPMDAPAEAPSPEPAPSGARPPRAPAKKSRGRRAELQGRSGQQAQRWKSEERKRKSMRQLYRKLDTTKEWAENNYYKLPIAAQNANLVKVNGFWRDYAGHAGSGAFFSEHLAEASRNFTEMMFALSVLDLPFKAGKHEASFANASMTLAASSPLVVFHKGIKPAQAAEGQAKILVSQNLFRRGDRYQVVDGERVDKFVSDEFLIHTVYGCQVVVTNPTSSRQKLDVLLQIPAGAIPVLGGKMTRSLHMVLDPYRTQSLEYFFYFPAPGKLSHYPVHVAKDEKIVAKTAPRTLNVVEALSTVDTTSWDYVSQRGTNAQVIGYLQTHNIEQTDLSRMAFRLKDRAFFDAALALLSKRHRYDDVVWSYAVMHDVPGAIRQFLLHQRGFIGQCGSWLRSPLLVIDPVVQRTYEHLEYSPLVNARAHMLGKRRQILNDRFHQQYHRLLKILSYMPQLDDDALMAVTYYMLLQDRTEEALEFFARIDPAKLRTRLQYDYTSAYLAVTTGELDRAKQLCAKHAKHPVDRWRSRFAAVAAQLEEIEGGGEADVVDPKDRTRKQTQLAASEASFELQVESRQVSLEYQNVEQVQVNYYLMDLELLFSRNPFVQSVSGQFSFVRPSASETRELPKGKTQTTFALPERFHTSNVLVEVRGGGRTRSVAYTSNSLGVHTLESYGQVKVSERATGKPVPAAYVKVYAKMKNGQVRFYKDGYTDRRGRFDYTSLNTNELDHVGQFSLLVVSEANGAVVKRANPPQR